MGTHTDGQVAQDLVHVVVKARRHLRTYRSATFDPACDEHAHDYGTEDVSRTHSPALSISAVSRHSRSTLLTSSAR